MISPDDNVTLDALCGDWRIHQLKNGHRYSTDDLLVAWYAAVVVREAGFSVRRALDLGSGIGSVGLMVAWQLPAARLVTVEAQPQSLALARKSAEYNGISDRYDARLGDLRTDAPDTGDFDLVTGSPPYFDERAGVVSDRPQRGPCRFEQRGGVEDYCAAAAKAVAPGGRVVLVMATAGRERVFAGAEAAGLGVRRLRPIVFKAGRAPMIDLIALALGPGPCATEGELVVRAADNHRTDEMRAVRLAMGFPAHIA